MPCACLWHRYRTTWSSLSRRGNR